jgi:HlyD family secretion protein
VGLNKYQFEVQGQVYSLRYGMRARAEIVVERRRMIDLALAPFKQFKR